KPLVQLARQFHCLPVAIVLNVPEKLCQERNRSRDERNFGPHVVRQQQSQLRRVSGRPNAASRGRLKTSHFEETRIRRIASSAGTQPKELSYGESAQNGSDRCNSLPES